MKAKWEEQLEAMRRDLARQNEQWARVEDWLTSQRGLIPIPSEFIGELERVCAVTLPMQPARVHNGAIRA